VSVAGGAGAPVPGAWATELAFAHELADLADALTLPAWRSRRDRTTDVDVKDDGTWVTSTDRGVESAIRAAIAERFPEHAVLGEEEGLVGDPDAPRWIVDPIDGTSNFVKGNPIFATLVALRVGGDDVVGVVSAPGLGTRFDGVVGVGAHQDGRPVRVSEVDDLADAEIAFGGLSYFAERGLLGAVERAATRTRRQRGYGDFWAHCLVAAGSTEVAVEAAVSTWDLAAVRAVVTAAGGRFTDLDGVESADNGSALSSNGRLHHAALALVHGRPHG
jgi:histidinol-phosphatase